MSRQSAHEGGKVVSLTHRPSLPPGNIPGTRFCQRLSQHQGHIAAGRIVSMKNSNDIIGNRTRNLPTRSAMPQPTALPRASCITYTKFRMLRVMASDEGYLFCLQFVLRITVMVAKLCVLSKYETVEVSIMCVSVRNLHLGLERNSVRVFVTSDARSSERIVPRWSRNGGIRWPATVL